MKLVVFGAGGGTGRSAVEQAVELGYEVTAFVRRGSPVPAQSNQVRVVEGDAFDSEDVDRAVRGADSVLSILGARPWRFNEVCSRGTANIIAAMTAHGARRLVVLSSLGVAESQQQLGWFARKVMIPLLLERELADKERMERAVRGSGLDWVIVRLGTSVLTNGPARSQWRVSVDQLIQSRALSRSDLARFCLTQLVSDAYLRRAPLIA